MKVNLRKAQKQDLPEVLFLIKELATYEKAPDEVTVTLKELEQDGFSDHPIFEIILAENGNGVLGMAFYYTSYSTWKGRCLYLEDIIVKEKFRRLSIGKMLFEAVIQKAKEVKAKRLQWQVLDWNTPAIKFYEKYNAEISSEWLNGRLVFK
jgi:GNAT superfamily N-acetyltransferase